MAEIIIINSDNLIIADSVLNLKTGLNINDAAVTISVSGANGVAVSGQSWPTTLTYQTGSSGKYIGTLEDVLVVTENAKYYGTLVISGGAGLKLTVNVPIIVRDARTD